MFISIKKLWRYLCYFFQTRKVWNWPQQSKVLIYDAANSAILTEYLKPWNPEILHVREEKINMQVLLKSFFKKGRRSDSYIDCFIEKVNPCLIITTIDNAKIFYKISGRHPNIKTLFLQNGMRGYFEDIFKQLENLDSDTMSTFFVDYMLVFGSAIGEKYSQYLKGRVLLAGSIKNNFVPKENSSQPGVIAFIGHWRLDRGRKNTSDVARGNFFEDIWTRPDTLIIQCLMRYARENDKRLIIIPNSDRNSSDLLSKEKDYHREIMGIEPEFSETSGPYPSYKAVDSAEIVVASDSTLAYESVARCKKTAFFAIRATFLEKYDHAYGWPVDFPDEGPFWTNKPDPDIFIRILDYLFKVSDEQWKKDVDSTNFSSLMEYDPGNTIFKSILEKELGPPPSSAH
ncbi:hypothetical protein M1N16_05715 [Nitrospinaceae bacterium]|nr:hypothetical protein [Nitrospinaceae bacterium]